MQRSATSGSGKMSSGGRSGSNRDVNRDEAWGNPPKRKDKKKGTQYESVDLYTQVYNLPSLGEEYQVVRGSMCFTINGLEQQTSNFTVTRVR